MLKRVGACGLTVAIAVSISGGAVASAATSPHLVESSEPPQAGGTLVYGHHTEPRLLDPIVLGPRAADDGHAGYAVFDSLVLTDQVSGETVPHLAESLDSSDATIWTLGLRDGVEFHDGTPLDAEAVKFNWERHIAEAAAPSPAVPLIESIEVRDPLTVEITLTEPRGEFPAMLGSLNFVGSPTAIREQGDQFGNDPVGAGPFVFEEWVRGSHLALSRNPDYWQDGKPYLDELVIRAMPDPTARFNALLAGDLTVGGVPPGEIAGAEDAGFVSMGDVPWTFGGAGWIFNAAKPPFDDQRARCAVAEAVSMDEMNEQLADGNAILVPQSFFHSGPNHDEGRAYSFDPEAAQATFDELAEENGSPLSFTYEALDLQTIEAEFYLTQLTAFENVEMELHPTNVPDLISMVGNGDHEMAGLGLGSGDLPPSVVLNQYLHSVEDGVANPWFGYTSPELDALLDTAVTSVDEDERNEALQGVEQILIEECLFRPTPNITLGPDYGEDTVTGWSTSTVSVVWEDVWLR